MNWDWDKLQEKRQSLSYNIINTSRPTILLPINKWNLKETLTIQGNEAVEQADLIIGAKRMA
ncbi:hypothetical protein, partial [Bilophila wadsworthia]|uniref:hypothetical protein n=1 Tax=Bilophila wadsworthia TaxID=35833 RepID=UPI003AB1933F